MGAPFLVAPGNEGNTKTWVVGTRERIEIRFVPGGCLLRELKLLDELEMTLGKLRKVKSLDGSDVEIETSREMRWLTCASPMD